MDILSPQVFHQCDNMTGSKRTNFQMLKTRIEVWNNNEENLV